MRGRKVTLRLNNDVVKKAKKLGINLSGFLEVKLVEYMTKFKGTPRERFELGFTSKKFTFSHNELEKYIYFY